MDRLEVGGLKLIANITELVWVGEDKDEVTGVVVRTGWGLKL